MLCIPVQKIGMVEKDEEQLLELTEQLLADMETCLAYAEEHK